MGRSWPDRNGPGVFAADGVVVVPDRVVGNDYLAVGRSLPQARQPVAIRVAISEKSTAESLVKFWTWGLAMDEWFDALEDV